MGQLPHTPAGVIARSVSVVASDKPVAPAIQWAAATVDQMITLRSTPPEKLDDARRLKANLERLLALAFEEVSPDWGLMKMETFTSDVWKQVVRVAAPTLWGHWFDTDVVRLRMTELIKRNLYTHANQKLLAGS